MSRRHYLNGANSELTLYSLEEQTSALLSPSPYEKPPETKVPDFPLRSLLTKQVKLAILNYGLLAFLEISFFALLPIFLSTALHFPPSTIGVVLGTMGLVNGLVQIALFVPLHRRVGTGNLYTIGLCALGIIFATFPFIKREWNRNGGSLGWKGMFLLAIQIALCPIENMSFSTYFCNDHRQPPNCNP